MKRIIDLIGAILGIFLFSPLILILALLAKLDSKGPGIIKLPRVGKDGRIFRLYKLRSMKYNAGDLNNPTDGEVTRVGRFLRSTFLDELPQFINIFKGEMSLVGPRPEIPSIVEKYNETQRERLKIKPGLTGAWQICQFRDRPIHEHLEYDFKYLAERSLLFDLSILLKTFIFCIKRLMTI